MQVIVWVQQVLDAFVGLCGVLRTISKSFHTVSELFNSQISAKIGLDSARWTCWLVA